MENPVEPVSETTPIEVAIKTSRELYERLALLLAEVQQRNEALVNENEQLKQQISDEDALKTRLREALSMVGRLTAENRELRARLEQANFVQGEEGQQQTFPETRRLILASGLFDEAWYLEKYPDVRESGMDPLEHYLQNGARRGLDPSPAFSTKKYLLRYPDVRDAGMNPLAHYVDYGRAEGRKID